MKATGKAVLVIVFAVVIIILALGVLGYVNIPIISPSSAVQDYYNGEEITGRAENLYNTMKQQNYGDFPPLSTIQSYGIEYHFYGTDDALSFIVSHYDAQFAGWVLEHYESGSGWTLKVWSRNAQTYAFGLAVWSRTEVKMLTGYETVYMTLEGPASAWQSLMLSVCMRPWQPSPRMTT